MADSKLQPLLDAAAKADGLPWTIDRDTRPGMEWNNFVVQENARHMAVCFMSHDGTQENSAGEGNVAFIVAASQSVSEIQRLVSLELRLREYVGSLKKYGSNFTPMELSSPGVEARMSFAAAQVKQLEEILEKQP